MLHQFHGQAWHRHAQWSRALYRIGILRVFCLLCVVCCTRENALLTAQTLRERRTLDSLRPLLATQIPDTTRVQILAKLSRLLAWTNIEQSEGYARTALGLAT